LHEAVAFLVRTSPGSAPIPEQSECAISVLAMTSREEPDGAILVMISGELDRSNQAMLRSWFRELDDHGPVVLDLAGTSFVNATLLPILVEACERGTDLSVRNAPPHLQALLTVYGMATLLERT
jgi:anti-anti-sigma regulatory factor